MVTKCEGVGGRINREIGINICVCVHSVSQLYPTLYDSIDCGPSGSSVHGIFQARIVEWVFISSSRGSF